MNKTKKKIAINEQKGTLVAPNEEVNKYNKISFGLSYFQTRSIVINGFNNCYKRQIDSINAVSDFFETLKNINTFDKNSFFVPNVKRQFHYNEFTDDEAINRIENVLIKGYGLSSDKVREFERMYFEFSFYNGKRAIGTKIYDNIFEMLFLDPNHLICVESSRNVKSKLGFSIPGVFQKWEDKKLLKEDFNQNEYLKMIIEDYNNNKFESMEDIIECLKEITIT